MTRDEPNNVRHRRLVVAALAQFEAAVPEDEKAAIKRLRTKNEHWLRHHELGLHVVRGREP
jgi:hypothetical protein